MKRIYRNLICAVLIVVLTIGTVVHTYAQNKADITTGLLIGDVDHDNDVTVMDATAIQRALTDLRTFSELEDFLADTDGDRQSTIMDATVIQRRIAQLDNDFWCDSIVPRTPAVINIAFYTYYPTATYAADKVYANTPVRLCMNAEQRRISYYISNVLSGQRLFKNRYSIYVNGEVIQKDSDTPSIIYRFDKAGQYTISFVATNTFGDSSTRTLSVTVTDSPERPYLADAEFDEEEMTLRVQGAGGTGGYQYRYYIRHINPMEPTEEPTDEPWIPPSTEAPTTPSFTPEPRPDGSYQMVSDYTDADRIRIPDNMLNDGLEYQFFVVVKDSAGTESILSQVMAYDIQ